jgi:hypothetical protein
MSIVLDGITIENVLCGVTVKFVLGEKIMRIILDGISL